MSTHATGTIPIRELGADHSIHLWKDYRSVLPPEEYDETFLLNLLADETLFDAPENSPLPWVPLHAWRALGQMRSLRAMELVLRLAEDDDQHAHDDFAKLCQYIGEKAVDSLLDILSDQGRSEVSRSLAAKGLGAIGSSAQGSTRARIVESLMNQIRDHDASDGWVSGMAARALMTMGERSVGPEILKLYDEGHIQTGMVEAAELTRYFGRP